MEDSPKVTYGLRAQVDAYFERQAERLLSESRAAASLTSHRGLYGLAGEEAVRSFLRNHLPGKYEVGTGHVISYRENSAQVDAVIYDAHECFKIPITEASTLFSIEGVYAAVEIKSSPSKHSNIAEVIKEAVSNIESIQKVTVPLHFSGISEIPVFTNLADEFLLEQRGQFFVKPMYPVSSILLLGTGTKFDTIVKHFREAQDSIQYWHNRPDLLCVIDEQEYGLCGFDFIPEDNQVVPNFWRETCNGPGQTLVAFLYWLVHKMTFERIIERPIFYNQRVQAVWPSVIAPVVQRIGVHVTGSERSWPWPNETRIFEP